MLKRVAGSTGSASGASGGGGGVKPFSAQVSSKLIVRHRGATFRLLPSGEEVLDASRKRLRTAGGNRVALPAHSEG
eukprot:1487714-Prymnesium_polylepis.1